MNQNENANQDERRLSPYQKFANDNRLRAKSLLMNDPAERTILNASGHQIILNPGDFIRGEPTFIQITLKLTTMWDTFDMATKRAYY